MKDYLIHHGILGQKWGVRRYQNPDGTLTSAGRRKLKGLYDFKNDKVTEKGYKKTKGIYRQDRHYQDFYKFNKIDPNEDDLTAEVYELLEMELNEIRKSMSDGEKFVNEFIYQNSDQVRNNYPGLYNPITKFKSSSYSPMSMNELNEDDKYGYLKDLAEIKLMEKLEEEELRN